MDALQFFFMIICFVVLRVADPCRVPQFMQASRDRTDGLSGLLAPWSLKTNECLFASVQVTVTARNGWNANFSARLADLSAIGFLIAETWILRAGIDAIAAVIAWLE